jgi:hypothetical protein
MRVPQAIDNQIIAEMRSQVFLGGTAGATTWRADIAIPMLESAGVSYFNPQLPPGAWTEECEAAEMLAKDSAGVLLFVLTPETRGIATVAEIAFYLGIARPLALCIEPVSEGAIFDQRVVTPSERDDLNRGRIFVRTMAAQCGVPLHASIDQAVRHAIELVQSQQRPLSLHDLEETLRELRFGQHRFEAQRNGDGFLIHISGIEADSDTGQEQRFHGREWFIPVHATRSDIVRTALKAALTWQEHEVRETLTYRGRKLFSPHFSVDRLTNLFHR